MLTPLALLAGLFLPACGAMGAHGVPATAPDFAHLARPSSPNTALAAPAGFRPAPDIVTPEYPVPAAELFGMIRKVATGMPATYVLAEDEAAMRQGWVVRSRLFNFPDIVWAQVESAGNGKAELVLYSRSVYGYGDFGVNRRRVAAWVAGVDALAARERR